MDRFVDIWLCMCISGLLCTASSSQLAYPWTKVHMFCGSDGKSSLTASSSCLQCLVSSPAGKLVTLPGLALLKIPILLADYYLKGTPLGPKYILNQWFLINPRVTMVTSFIPDTKTRFEPSLSRSTGRPLFPASAGCPGRQRPHFLLLVQKAAGFAPPAARTHFRSGSSHESETKDCASTSKNRES